MNGTQKSNGKRVTSNEGSFSRYTLLITRYALLAFMLSVFFFSVSLAQFDANDPSSRASNARVIGMGRAFSGLADDTAAIYFNPAGLANQQSWQLSSMSGSFMEEFSYLSFNGFYPTNFGTVGIGYGGYSVGGIYPTTTLEGSDPRDPIYIIDTTTPQISNYNNVLTLSYASGLDRYLSRYLGFSDKIDFGLNLKLFSAGLSGDHIVNGNATGQEMDAGIIIKALPALKVGMTAQNFLPATMGGKLTYLSGHTETYPALLKIGGALKILGPEDSLRTFMNQELVLALDIDSQPTINSYPILYHIGSEWKPHPMVSIRLGLDQVAADDGTRKYVSASNLTYGVGLTYSSFRFDYAYHNIADLPIASSYFSLSYVPVLPKRETYKDKVSIAQPSDKSIIFDQSAKISGKAYAPDIKVMEINNNRIILAKNNSFEAEVPLSVGKNKIELKSYSEKGSITKPIDIRNLRILRLSSFPDVPEGYWTRQQISLISMLNIVTGYPDGTFRPEGNITRAEMAALLMRSAGNDTRYPILDNRISNLEPRISFKDVKSSHWAAGFIADAASAGVVEGYPDKSFRPKGNITRAEGLAMIARFAKVTQEAYTFQFFPDISTNYWASPIIAGSSKAGLLEYLKGRAFEPKRNLTRAEAVEILYRTQFVKGLLDKDLLNWEGY